MEKTASIAFVLMCLLMAFATGCSTIHSAAGNGNIAAVKQYLQEGADVNTKDKDGRTPLMCAARFSNNPDIITALIKSGATLDVKGATLPVVGYKLQWGYELEVPAGRGTALMYAAAFNKNPKMIEVLMKAGADVNTQTSDAGITPLIIAAILNRNPEIMATLIKAGGNVNGKTFDGHTPLMWAAIFNNNPNVIECLIKAGANVNAKDTDGHSVETNRSVHNPVGTINQLLMIADGTITYRKL